jgi:hypothetical protein
MRIAVKRGMSLFIGIAPLLLDETAQSQSRTGVHAKMQERAKKAARGLFKL